MLKDKILLFVFAVCIVLAAIISAIRNLDEFLSVNIFNLLTLLVALVFTYYFNQQKQTHRRFHDSAVKVLESIQKIIENDFICKGFNEHSIKELIQSMRIVRNKLAVLKKVEKNLNISTEIEYLDNNFNNYKNIIDNHISDYDYLEKSADDLNNFTSLLDSKITETIVKIYQLDL